MNGGTPEDLASLGIAVDSTPVDKATTALKGLQTQGAATATEMSKLEAKVTAALQAQYNMTAVQAKTIQGLQAYSTEANNATKGIQSITHALEELNAIKAKQNAANTQAEIAAAFGIGVPAANSAKASASVFKEALGDIKHSVEETGASWRLNSTAIRELITVPRELASGNFNRVPGSLSILLTSLKDMPPQIMGVVAAVGVLTAAFGTLAVAAYQGEEDDMKLQRGIISTGNYAGVTASQIDNLSHSISGEFNQGIRSVRGGLEELVASGRFSSDTIKVMTEDAVMWSQRTGQSVSDVLKSYEQAKTGLIPFAVKQEEAYHNITLAQLEEIDAMEKAGKHHEAELKYFQDIQDNIKNRAIPAYGLLQLTLHDTATFASNMWDALLGIGRQGTLDEKIRNVAGVVRNDAAALRQATLGGDAHNIDIVRNNLLSDLTNMNALTSMASGQQIAAARQAKNAQDESDKVQNWFDHEWRKRNGKGRTSHEHEHDEENYEAATAKINDQAAGLLHQADAYEASTLAQLHFKAAADAVASAEDKTVTVTEIAARTQANYNKAIGEALLVGAKDADKVNDKAIAQDKVNQLVASGVMTQVQAQRFVELNIQLQTLEEIAQKGNNEQRAEAIKQIKALTDAYNHLNAANDTQDIQNNVAQLDLQNQALAMQLRLINATNQEKARAAAVAATLANAKSKGRPATADELAFAISNADAQSSINDRGAQGATGAKQRPLDQANAAIKGIIELEQNSYRVRLANRTAFENQIKQAVQAGTITEKQHITAMAQYDADTMESRLENADHFFGRLATLSSSKNKELAIIGKAAAVAQATIDGVLAVQHTLAHTPAPWNIPLAAAEAAIAAANVATIISTPAYAAGGYVVGPGGPRDDSINARISNGEFIVNAAATARNRAMLESINGGGRFANGGYVGSSSGVVNHFDFSGANFGGTDPKQVAQQIDNLMRTKYGPAIVQQSVATSITVQAKQNKRQKLNARAAS